MPLESTPTEIGLAFIEGRKPKRKLATIAQDPDLPCLVVKGLDKEYPLLMKGVINRQPCLILPKGGFNARIDRHVRGMRNAAIQTGFTEVVDHHWTAFAYYEVRVRPTRASLAEAA